MSLKVKCLCYGRDYKGFPWLLRCLRATRTCPTNKFDSHTLNINLKKVITRNNVIVETTPLHQPCGVDDLRGGDKCLCWSLPSTLNLTVF